MHVDIPLWLTALSWAYVAVALGTAVLLYAELRRGTVRPSTTSTGLWLITALYMGPLAWWAYRRVRRSSAEQSSQVDGGAAGRLDGALPGGAASAVAHVIGVPIVALLGLTAFGLQLWAMILVIAVLAAVLLFVWGLSKPTSLPAGRQPLVAAVSAVALVAVFDLGMGGWMLFLHYGWIMPPASDVTFVFLMQVGLLLGCLTALPFAGRVAVRDVTAVR